MIRCITFDETSRTFILDAFNKAVDSEGFIINRAHPHNRVRTPDGEEIHIDEWGGIRKGREGEEQYVFFKNDIVTLTKISDILGGKHD